MFFCVFATGRHESDQPRSQVESRDGERLPPRNERTLRGACAQFRWSRSGTEGVFSSGGCQRSARSSQLQHLWNVCARSGVFQPISVFSVFIPLRALGMDLKVEGATRLLACGHCQTSYCIPRNGVPSASQHTCPLCRFQVPALMPALYHSFLIFFLGKNKQRYFPCSTKRAVAPRTSAPTATRIRRSSRCQTRRRTRSPAGSAPTPPARCLSARAPTPCARARASAT